MEFWHYDTQLLISIVFFIGLFGQIEYSLTGYYSDNFDIDTKTGDIVVINAEFLDFETRKEISFAAIANDLAPAPIHRSNSVLITVKLSDLNDNTVYFTKKKYETTIAENVAIDPPAAIIQVKASDNDTCESRILKYSIESGADGIFEIDSYNGIIYTTKSLQGYEREFIMLVKVHDNSGQVPHSDEAEVYIKVIQINKNKPIFIHPTVNNERIELLKNKSEKDNLNTTVLAHDPDKGRNGRLSYHFKVGDNNIQETEHFLINADSGQISPKQNLENHTKKLFEILLVVKDQGTPSYETIRLVSICLFNEKIHPVELNKNVYKFHIVENMPSGTKVGRVQLNLKENLLNHLINFKFMTGNEDNNFHIDPISGEIITNCQLDREKQSFYELFVLTYTFNNTYQTPIHNKHTIKVEIYVKDVNDCVPVWEKNIYMAGISSQAALLEPVTIINVQDCDNEENSALELTLKTTYLYKYGFKTIGSIVPSPFSKFKSSYFWCPNKSIYWSNFKIERYKIKIEKIKVD